MLKYFGKSDIGRIRSDNEDYYTVKKIGQEETLFIVADGMGGHQAGDVASSLGTTSFAKQYKKLRAGETSIPKSLKIALEKANNSILDKATKEPDKKGMGTTFSAFVVEGKKGYIIHIGDSRIYQIRNNKIKQLTIDHTFVEKMVQNGKITRKEARNHPHRNILYYSLGAREVLEPHIINEFEIYDGDSFLMCSDGLSTMVEDSVLKDYCLLYPPEKAVEELINLANKNGGSDNITVQVLHFGDVPLPDKTEPLDVESFRVKVSKLNKSFWIMIVLLVMLIIMLFVLFIL